MHPQQIIIVDCACLAMMFSVVSRRLVGNGRRWTLLLAAFVLFAVAGYESYMTFVWEKTVSAAIRLDIFVIDLPIMFISIIAGVLAWSKKPVNHGSPKIASGLILLGTSASLFALGGCNNQRAPATQQQEARTEVPPRAVPSTRPPQPATVQTPVDALYQQAQGLSHSDIHKAMELLEAAIAKAPDSPNSAPYYLLLGRLKKEFENCQLDQANSPLDNPKKQCEDFTEYAKARPTEYFYNEVGGDYLYRGVHFQELEKRFPSSALAVEAAYEITNLSKGGECEGFLDCYIESAFSPVRDFLLRYPDSLHTQEAIKRADDAFRKTLWGDVWKTEWTEIKDPNQASDYYDPTNLKKMVQEYEDLAEKLPLRFRARPWETVAYYRNRFGEKDRARELYEKIVRQFPDYENIGEVRQNLATLK